MMRTTVLLLALGLSLGAAPVDERRTIQQSFPLPAGGKLLVDNIWGSIKVTGVAGSEVRATVQERLTADSPADAASARRDVKLDMGPAAGGVRFYVDGPFRDHHGDHGRLGYQVRYDFEIQAPAGAAVELKNVNGGGITLESTTGDYTIRNVNGGIELRDVSGSGQAHTVNGPVRAAYRANPRGPCSFQNINGALEATFQPGLSADLSFKTLNGAVYTDFDNVTYLPRVQPAAERRGARYVYRSDHRFEVRVGAGGPTISFDGLNGDIQVLKRGQ